MLRLSGRLRALCTAAGPSAPTSSSPRFTSGTYKQIVEQISEQLGQLIAAQDVAPVAKRYACLVDAENTQYSKLADVVDELSGFGEVVVRRIYADFTKIELTPWKRVSNELSFRPFTQFAIVSGKGSSDMAMAMDAIDLMHNEALHVDGFALVSSDSDFTPLGDSHSGSNPGHLRVACA